MRTVPKYIKVSHLKEVKINTKNAQEVHSTQKRVFSLDFLSFNFDPIDNDNECEFSRLVAHCIERYFIKQTTLLIGQWP